MSTLPALTPVPIHKQVPVFSLTPDVLCLKSVINISSPPPSLTPLQKYYLVGPNYINGIQPANQAITRTSIYNNPLVTTQSIARLAAARAIELNKQRQDVLAIDIPPPSELYTPKTLAQLISLFLAAGAVSPIRNIGTTGGPTPTLPDANSTALGDLRTQYNMVKWTGNTTSYLQCDLANRGSDYLGICWALNVTCTTTNNDTAPYKCFDLLSNANVTGTVASPTYRLGCELPCDRVQDCTTLCECWSSCSTSEVCVWICGGGEGQQQGNAG